jgi:hypothetical protein
VRIILYNIRIHALNDHLRACLTHYCKETLSKGVFDVDEANIRGGGINYLCTYDLYGPVHKVFDLGR